MSDQFVKVKGVADIVFVIDCSESMSDIIDALKNHLSNFINELINSPQSTVKDVRLGLVTHAGSGLMSHGFLASVSEFSKKLKESLVGGEEAGLPAIDFALDLPWRTRSRRYIVFFSDEGVDDGAEPERQKSKLMDLAHKMSDLHVKFLGYNVVGCPSYNLLGKTPGSSYTVLTRENITGASMDNLLMGIAKTVTDGLDSEIITTVKKNIYSIQFGDGNFIKGDKIKPTLKDILIRVTSPNFDNIGEVLKKMGISFEKYLGNFNCDILFINCGTADYINSSELQRYVKNGGVIYASDLTSVLIDTTFPNIFNFDHFSGNVETHEAFVMDNELRSLIGKKVKVFFDMPVWSILINIQKGKVLLKSLKTSHPLMVEVPYGKGMIYYTCFHNHSQLDKKEEKLLKLLILKQLSQYYSTTIVNLSQSCNIKI